MIAEAHHTNVAVLSWERAAVINMQTHAAGLDELHAYSPTSHLLNSLSGPHTDCQMTTCLFFSCPLKFLSGERERDYQHPHILCLRSVRLKEKKKSSISVQTLPVKMNSQRALFNTVQLWKMAREIFGCLKRNVVKW